MKEVFLGEVIKQRRIELGLTQAQLCEGICEPMTISRFENGKQTPSRANITALLHRLGLPDDRFYALLSKHEQEIDALEKEIVSYNVRFQNALDENKRSICIQCYQKIHELENLIEDNDHITKQFIIRSKIILGKENGEPFQPEEKLDMLMVALKLTVPHFDLDEIGKNLYSLDEVKIINQIAGIYSDMKQFRKTVEIYRQLFKYIQKHYQNIIQSAGHLPLIAHNYSLALYDCKRYEEAIEIAEIGRRSCIESGHYQFLAGLLHILAICYQAIGKDEMSKEYFYQSYYLYRATNNEKGALLLQEDARKAYQIEFFY